MLKEWVNVLCGIDLYILCIWKLVLGLMNEVDIDIIFVKFIVFLKFYLRILIIKEKNIVMGSID